MGCRRARWLPSNETIATVNACHFIQHFAYHLTTCWVQKEVIVQKEPLNMDCVHGMGKSELHVNMQSSRALAKGAAR